MGELNKAGTGAPLDGFWNFLDTLDALQPAEQILMLDSEETRAFLYLCSVYEPPLAQMRRVGSGLLRFTRWEEVTPSPDARPFELTVELPSGVADQLLALSEEHSDTHRPDPLELLAHHVRARCVLWNERPFCRSIDFPTVSPSPDSLTFSLRPPAGARMTPKLLMHMVERVPRWASFLALRPVWEALDRRPQGDSAPTLLHEMLPARLLESGSLGTPRSIIARQQRMVTILERKTATKEETTACESPLN